MGKVGISFDFYGEEQIKRSILAVENRVEDASPAFKNVAEFIRKVERKQWSTRGAFGGNRWAPLKPLTVSRKRSKGGQAQKNATKILRETDALWKSVTTKGAGSLVKIDADSMLFSTSVFYGAIHQAGAPGANLPARRVFDMNALTREEIVRVLAQYIGNGTLTKGVFR